VFMQNNNSVLPLPFAMRMSELLVDAWAPPPTPLNPQTPGIPTPADLRITATPTGVVPPWANENGPLTGGSQQVQLSPMTEIVQIHRRLKDTMVKNDLYSHHASFPFKRQHDDLYGSDTIAKTLGLSISAVEIQQRGVATQGNLAFLESFPQLALTHLRVLAETAASYVSIGGLRAAGDNAVTREFSRDYSSQFHKLFLKDPYTGLDVLDIDVSDFDRYVGNSRELPSEVTGPLLAEDIFLFLTECSLCLAPVDQIDIMNLVRLCYLAEMTKVILLVTRNRGKSHIMDVPDEHKLMPDFLNFCGLVYSSDTEDGNDFKDGVTLQSFEQPCFENFESFRIFVKKYVTVFLRKVTILLHVRYGVVFNNHISTDPDADELDRLTEALRLPSFDKMCSLPVNEQAINFLVKGWITHANYPRSFESTLDISHQQFEQSLESLSFPGIVARSYEESFPSLRSSLLPPIKLNLAHPAIFELIGLPKNYDTLMEEAMKRRCPTTGKDVSDPMLCLFCGVITCGQSICCAKDRPRKPGEKAVKIGGAQQHMLK
jgi:E3 ubiquitin-protein ligase UBR1